MSQAPSSPVAAPLASARSLALYGLSLSAGAAAVLAWPRPGSLTGGLLAATLGLAAAQILGEGPASWWGGTLGPRARTRIRIWVGVVYSGLAILGLAVVIAEPKLMPAASELLLFAQGLFLLGLDVLGGPILAIANALMLVLLACFRGGLPAAASVTAFLGLLVFFLTFDRFAHLLAWYPTREVSLTGAAFGEAARIAVPLVLGFLLLFAVKLPAPYSRLPLAERNPAPLPQQVEEAYQRLLLLALAGGGSVFLAARLLRRDSERAPLREETVEPLRSGEEALPARPARLRQYPGARGRIVRAYVRVLAQASRVGLRLKASLTPTQIAARLREPADAVSTLTTLFVRARYGPEELKDAEAGRAEGAARLILGRLRPRGGRPRAGRDPWGR